MSGLQTFSDWVLSLLPRLFLFPGGLIVVGALFCAVVLGSKPRAYRLRAVALVLVQANTLSIAAAWAALALLPFSGVAPLPLPGDRLSLVALLLFSLLAETTTLRKPILRGAYGEVGISLALLAPLAGGHGLLSAGSIGAAPWAAMVAVVAGALAFSFYGTLPGTARLAAWLLLAALPFSGSLEPLALAGGCLLSLFLLGLVSSYVAKKGFQSWANLALGAAVVLSLMLSLLGI